jgi:multimeric flavodoxin WrbA
MKALVAHDSYYGNTKLVAEAIAEELQVQGHSVELRSLRTKYPDPPVGDVVFVASPVRMGSATRRAKKFIKGLDMEAWRGKPFAVLTTILELSEDVTPQRMNSRGQYDIPAGARMADLARAEGLAALEDHLWADVRGNKGPLVETGIERAKEFTRNTPRSLGHA